MADAVLDALNARPPPAWYDAAKFGVFIHWGMFAVPAFAPKVGSIGEVFRTDYDRAVAMTPYTEWYWNAIRTPGTPSADFHAAHYGDAPYEAFKQPFLDGLKHWDPDEWAERFRDAGARYVVLVTKHHDGFCLWPSAVANRHQADWTSGRNIVGELARAVRAAGLRFGVYYSGGIDWTFNRRPLLTLGDFITSTPGGDYLDYAEAQVRELIDRYQPSILWNDIAWPTGPKRLYALFEAYYRAVPDGLVNDRWVTASPARNFLRNPVAKRALDIGLKAAMARRKPEAEKGVIPQPVPHSGFRTPEYAAFETIQAKKWEATRGMSHSFGFNRNDTEVDYESAETLIGGLIEAVSRNGNLLLNVGPRATDASIPDEQTARLKTFGVWLRANGEAIYGAECWTRSDGETADGTPVRFTVKGGLLNLVPLGKISGAQVMMRDLIAHGEGVLLADGSPVVLEQQGSDLALTFARPLNNVFAPAIAIPLAGAR
jgi:alpha-L-fucosidase